MEVSNGTNFTWKHLKGLTMNDLRTIIKQKGLKCSKKKAECIQTILNSQEPQNNANDANEDEIVYSSSFKAATDGYK